MKLTPEDRIELESICSNSDSNESVNCLNILRLLDLVDNKLDELNTRGMKKQIESILFKAKNEN
jgi:hypothetical protein